MGTFLSVLASEIVTILASNKELKPESLVFLKYNMYNK